MYYNAFEVLGVPHGSSLEVCKKAYRLLVKKYHPDVNKAKDAQQKFLLIQKAYEIVCGKQTPTAPPPPPQQQVVVVQYVRWGGNGTGYTVTWN